MLVAKVRVRWLLSPSADVKTQDVLVTVDGNEVISVVPADVDFVVFEVPEKSVVTVGVKPYDGFHYGDIATLSFDVPDLSKPAPVSMIDWEILDVYDVEEPDGPPEGPEIHPVEPPGGIPQP